MSSYAEAIGGNVIRISKLFSISSDTGFRTQPALSGYVLGLIFLLLAYPQGVSKKEERK
jgi:hypothetical protein